MLIRVDPASEVPLFDQLATGIRVSIMSGSVAAGERLPPARELADSLDINVHTVLRAYQELRDDGLIELRRGRGATVAANARDYSQLTTAITALVAEAKKLGIPAPALAALIRESYK